MATKAWINKANKPPKFRVRVIRRCQLCGRSRAVYRKFRICRICLRTLAHEGKIPGMRKASW
jgi:small subunit ribosomal protein S14